MTAGIPDSLVVTMPDDAAALVLSQFHHGTTDGRSWTYGPLEDLVRILTAEVALAEGITHNLITERLLSTAVGAQLDQWGRRLGCARLGMGDDDYRAMLYTWIMVLTSHGDAATIQEIVRRLSGATGVIYRNAGRAHFMITYDLATPTTAQRRALIEQALERAACLGVSWTVTEVDSAGYFGFGEDADAMGFDQGILGQVVAQVNA